jgi:8-oxo-dGTP pyrophosphatase MutT (NUDIX family)
MESYALPPNRVVRIVVIDTTTRKLLLVTSRDRPDLFELPGGKAKQHETTLEAARRELHEETGLHPATLIHKHTLIRNTSGAHTKRYEHHIFLATYATTPSITMDTDEIIDHTWQSLEAAQAFGARLEWLTAYYLRHIRSPTTTTKR